MYGTIARIRVRPGMEARLRERMQDGVDAQIPGFIGQYIYRMDKDQNEYYLVVLFQSKKSYIANANSPEQDARYRQFRALLAADPEWHDGVIVSAFHPEAATPARTRARTR